MSSFDDLPSVVIPDFSTVGLGGPRQLPLTLQIKYQCEFSGTELKGVTDCSGML
jgi:hypothetical protein